MLNWEIGEQIRAYVLNDQRADYGKQVINQLSQQMTREFGKGWGAQHLRHCLRIAETFPDREIVYALRRQLSWTHFRSVIYLEDPHKRDFYLEMCAQDHVRRKEGGVIRHTQGSGKSIVMVLLAKWILENNSNARVAVITDRDELDKQMLGNMRAAGMLLRRLSTIRLCRLSSDSTAYVVGAMIFEPLLPKCFRVLLQSSTYLSNHVHAHEIGPTGCNRW